MLKYALRADGWETVYELIAENDEPKNYDKGDEHERDVL